jgi:hypothetical protein
MGTDLKGVERDGMAWVQQDKGNIQGLNFVNTAMNICVLQKTVSILITRVTIMGPRTQLLSAEEW